MGSFNPFAMNDFINSTLPVYEALNYTAERRSFSSSSSDCEDDDGDGWCNGSSPVLFAVAALVSILVLCGLFYHIHRQNKENAPMENNTPPVFEPYTPAPQAPV